MNKQSFNLTKRFTAAPLFLLLMLMAAACSKKDTPQPDPQPEEKTNPTAFYKLQRVENFAATTDDNAAVIPATVFFSLENNAGVIPDYAKTNRWDIAFGGLYNSFLSGNNGSDKFNYGYGATGKGGILILTKSFDKVTDVPADADFKTVSDVTGPDDAGDYGAGTGWYLYDFNGTRVRDGAYSNQHIAYALSNGLTLKNGTQLSPRTVVVRTAKGDYAKIRMISCYKDAFSIEKWSRDVPHMYFTFEYVMVPAGSKKFEIK